MPPVNDNWANAIALVGPSGTVTGTNVGATLEAGEDTAYGDGGTETVWWKFTSGSDGRLMVDTVGSGFDTVLDVYVGSAVATLRQVAFSDETSLAGGGGTVSTSLLRLDARAGVTYYIRVRGYGAGTTGSITLSWVFTNERAAGTYTVKDTKTGPTNVMVFPWDRLEGGFGFAAAVPLGSNTMNLVVGNANQIDSSGDYMNERVHPKLVASGWDLTLTDNVDEMATLADGYLVTFTKSSTTTTAAVTATLVQRTGEPALWEFGVTGFGLSEIDVGVAVSSDSDIADTTFGIKVQAVAVDDTRVLLIWSVDRPTTSFHKIRACVVERTGGTLTVHTVADLTASGFTFGPSGADPTSVLRARRAGIGAFLVSTGPAGTPTNGGPVWVSTFSVDGSSNVTYDGDTSVFATTAGKYAQPVDLARTPSDSVMVSRGSYSGGVYSAVEVFRVTEDGTAIPLWDAAGFSTAFDDGSHHTYSDGYLVQNGFPFVCPLPNGGEVDATFVQPSEAGSNAEEWLQNGLIGSASLLGTLISAVFGQDTRLAVVPVNSSHFLLVNNSQYRMVGTDLAPFTPPPLTAPTPADAPGWCVETLHDFHADPTPYIGGRGLAISPDDRYVYTTSGADVLRIDTTTWTVANPWVTLSTSIFGIAADFSGNLYVSLSDGTISKVTPSGTVTAGWAVLPAGWGIKTGLSLGSDGNLYAAAHATTGNLDTVFAISTSGVVTEVGPLRTAATVSQYDYVTALGDGTAFASLDSPPAPYVGVDTTLRRATPVTPSRIDVDHSEHLEVARSGDATGGSVIIATSLVGGVTADVDILAIAITGGATLNFTGTTWTIVDQHTAGTVTAYLIARAGRVATDAIPVVGATGEWYAFGAGDSVFGLSVPTIGSGAITAYDPGTLTWLAAPSVSGTGEAMYFLAGGWFNVSEPTAIPTFDPPTPAAHWRTSWDFGEYGDVIIGPPGGSGSVRVAGWLGDPASPSGPIATPITSLAKGFAAVIYVGADSYAGSTTDLPIQTLADPADGDTEAYGGLFVDDRDHLMIPMTHFGGNGVFRSNLGWWLRVGRDGSASRIAGTWSYTSAPTPAATATDIADGPLNSALCAELDNGVGLSSDRQTLYFIDDGNEPAGRSGNLIRKLALCEPLTPPTFITPGPANSQAHRIRRTRMA